MTIDFSNRGHLHIILLNFAQDLDLVFVDDDIPVGDPTNTFRVHTTGASSAIDHFAVFQSLRDNIQEVKVIISDIRPCSHFT